MDKFVLIDGNSLLNRAFYATPIFTTKSGIPTNAIFGFVKLLLKIVDDNKPKYLLVAFDKKAPTFRHEMYASYKGTRKGMPDELAAQLIPLKDLLNAMNISIYEQAGIEADDIMGSLSHKFNVHSYIYTGDHDVYQLVDDKTDVCFTKKGVSDLLCLNKDNFYDELGINPSQIIDMKALMGDTSDNIPGVAGIGEKTAHSLISEYYTLDNIYKNINNIKGALKKKLEDGKESAYLSYKLATIRRDCELNIDLENCVYPKKYGYDVKKMFADLEFRSLLSLNIFEDDNDVNKKDVTVYQDKLIVSEKEQIIGIIRKNNKFYADLGANVLQIFVEGNLYEINYTDGLITDFTLSDYQEVLSYLFENNKNHIYMFDVKTAMHQLENYNIEFKASYDDVSVISYLTGSSVAPDLKTACNDRLIDSAYCVYGLKAIYEETITNLKNELLKLYEDIEHPLVKVLYEMEHEGITVSRTELDALGTKYNEKLAAITQEIYMLCGCEFNINSPAQLGDMLFNKLGLKAGKKNKRGQYSTNAETLETLAGENEVVALVLKYRQYAKLYSTYIEAFKPLIGSDEKIHTTYNQTITTTGRLSSTNPNMQNIPIRDGEGRELRKMFVPKDGNVLIDADYSQIELRLLAHFSGCQTLIDAYNNDADIHTLTAAKVFGVDTKDVTPIMRRNAKAVNFGIIYGISDFGLSKQLNISVSEAKKYIENYFIQYPEVQMYMKSNVDFAKNNGYVTTFTGRKRIIPELNSSVYNIKSFGERAAMNMPLQGSSADIIKIAMVNVANTLKAENMKSKLILQVHDELVIEATVEEYKRATEILVNEMENAVKLTVPLKVEAKIGANWYDTK